MVGCFFHVAIHYRGTHGKGHGGTASQGEAKSVPEEQIAR